MKGIYLGACRAYHPNFDLDYNDIEITSNYINVVGDMLSVDLSSYDYIIATPPCNWWSKANPYYKTSIYSLSTKHLLPCILEKLSINCKNKPFIIENVRNYKRFNENGIFDICNKYGIFYYFYGRHTYFTNVMIDFSNIPQQQDFVNGGKRINNDGYNQGGKNVFNCIDYWIKYVLANYF